MFDKLLGGVSIAVQGLHGNNEELEELGHFELVFDYEVELLFVCIDGEALLTMKGQVFEKLLPIHGDDVLPQHPESGGEAAKHE